MTKTEKILTVILFSGLFLYLVLRGFYVQMIHDEIATFFRFVHLGKFIPYHSEWSTNNHFLNSLLTFISYKIFGYSTIAQRLPNLLFIPVYLYFVYKISLELKDKLFRWGFIIMMIGIHNYMEFFSLSRGYGISFSLVAAGIWYTIKVLQTNKVKYYILSLVSMLLSASAILIMVNSYILLTGFLSLNIIYNYRSNRAKLFKYLLVILFLGIIPIVLIVIYLLDLNKVGRLDYGGEEGFWENSVKDLTDLLAFSASDYLQILVLIFFIIICVIFIINIFYYFRKYKKGTLFKPQWLFFYFLIGNIIGFKFEHDLFGILYPESRTSLQFIIFFFGSLFFVLDQLEWKYKNYSWLLLLPFLFFPFHFITHANLSWSSLENENIPLRFYRKVRAEKTEGQPPPTIAGYRGRLMRWNFHNFIEKGELSIIKYSDYSGLDADFQIANINDYPVWRQYYDSIDSDPVSKLSLLKRKHKLAKTLVYQKQNIFEENAFNGEFYLISEGLIDSLAGNPLYTGFNLQFCTEAKPFQAWIVTSISDVNQKQLIYEYIALDWFRTEWNCTDKPFINGLLISNLPDSAYSYKTYLWNIQKVPFEIKHGEFWLYKLDRDYQEVNW